MKNLRLWLPVTALAAVMAAGCMLVSGQFIVTFNFADHGADPLTVTGSSALSGVAVDLNSIGDYNDHKSDLKGVADLAIVGKLTNLDTTAPVSVEIWLVETPGTPLTSDAAVRSAGKRLWGPVTLAASGVKNIGWDESASLFKGRQDLIAQIKGDGRFDLYALGSGGYHFKIDKGVLIAVITAGK